MKKSALLLIGLSAIGLCSWEARDNNPQQVLINMDMEDNHIPSTAERIELKGRLDLSAGPDDIEAGATEQTVYLYFNQSFGDVSISLYNASGLLIYGSVVDTSMQQLVVVPITSMESGTYSVVLSNANGLAEGDFERRSH